MYIFFFLYLVVNKVDYIIDHGLMTGEMGIVYVSNVTDTLMLHIGI